MTPNEAHEALVAAIRMAVNEARENGLLEVYVNIRTHGEDEFRIASVNAISTD